MSDVASVAEMPASGVDDINSLLDLPLMGRSILESMTFGGVPGEGMCVEQLHTWVLAMGAPCTTMCSPYSRELVKWVGSNWPNICFDRPRQLRGSEKALGNCCQQAGA